MTDASAELVAASLTQIATGLTVETPHCVSCHQRLQTGTPVIAQLSHTTTTRRWAVAAVRCRSCPPAQRTPDAVVTATLATQSHPPTQTHLLCLVDVTPRTHH